MTNMKEDDISWFHGDLSREEAESILETDGQQEGSYLIRKSNSSTGDYVLSVLHNNQVCHFQIRRHTEDVFFSIVERTKIHGLESLIEYYVENPGTLADGLILTVAIKGEPPPHDLRRHGRTNLLHRATSTGSFKVVTELLRAGYRHEAKNEDGQTAVHLASMKGNDDILRELIEVGANVNSRDTAGYTPLHYACQNNFPSTVRLLVQVGAANMQARNTKNGYVSLHEAAAKGHKEVIREMLSLNAPVNPRNNEGIIPSQVARCNGFAECVEILENYKCPTPRTHQNYWYHGTLGRNEAEEMIRNYSTNSGTYLVRWSNRNKAAVLTLLNEDIFFNFVISKKGNYLFIDDGPFLESLEHIIEYYSFISDGLPTVLKTPVPPKPKPEVPDCSTMPRATKTKNRPTKHTPGSLKNEESPNKSFSSQFDKISFTSNLKQNTNNNNKEESDEYIHPDRIILGNLIDEGEFASVYEGTYTKPNGNKLNVAIKTLRSEQCGTNRNSFLHEAQIMLKLCHHCIVRLIGLCDGPTLLMVQELMPLGSLLHYLIKHRNKINPDYEFTIWAAQIACGMNYLEDQRFVHRDLAARNILLATQHQVKISDFGLSRALQCDREYYMASKGGKWPIKWYAPESYHYGNFNHKSDVWSFGVTIWEMFSFGDIPYEEMKGPEVINFIESGGRLEKPETCPEKIYEIMKRCWSYEGEDRPTFRSLSAFFTEDNDYINIRELLSEVDLA